MAIAGNKCDLEDRRNVSNKKVQNFAMDNGCLFKLISASNGMGIEELFYELGQIYEEKEKTQNLLKNLIEF